MKIKESTSYIEFEKIISDITNNTEVQKMNNFQHHNNTTCYSHCINVAYISYCVCKKFDLDFVSVARAGMLHDLFLYDWRTKDPNRKGIHAFTHPKLALENANKLFNLNDKEKDIILKHMWPSTLILPKYWESLIITFVDKYCAIKETFDLSVMKFELRKLYIYSYIFLSLFVLKSI